MGNTSKSVKEIPVKWIRKLTRDPNEIDLVVHYICKHGLGRYQECKQCNQEQIDWYEVRIAKLECGKERDRTKLETLEIRIASLVNIASLKLALYGTPNQLTTCAWGTIFSVRRNPGEPPGLAWRKLGEVLVGWLQKQCPPDPTREVGE